MELNKALCIIPARGGSKGIPRKNLRPLNGKPLLFYTVEAALKAREIACVIVSTDDDEIAMYAKRLGALVHVRAGHLAADEVTIDPVIADAAFSFCGSNADDDLIVLTIQPTSPLITARDIDEAVVRYESSEADTLVSVCETRHLEWTADPVFQPLYEERVNRQFIKAKYRETGAFVICNFKQLKSGSRFGDLVEPLILGNHSSIDVDGVNDLALCDAILARKKLLFITIGNSAIGLGHAFRCIMIANQFVLHELHFICVGDSAPAFELITSNNYSAELIKENDIHDRVNAYKPDLIINDRLDTSESDMAVLMCADRAIANFEDLGEGRKMANVVFNDLYEHVQTLPHEHVGIDYFWIRDEFLFGIPEPELVVVDIRNLLISFGGTDEGNLTCTVLESLLPDISLNNINVTVVLGPGYSDDSRLYQIVEENNDLSIEVFKSSGMISQHMLAADLAFTSGGRTVMELAAVRTPAVVICQNSRELSHTFASEVNGVLNLGLRSDVSSELIRSSFQRLISDPDLVLQMKKKMLSRDLASGKSRVSNILSGYLNHLESRNE